MNNTIMRKIDVTADYQPLVADRLEQDAKRQGKLVWLIVGATVVAAVSTLVQWIAG